MAGAIPETDGHGARDDHDRGVRNDGRLSANDQRWTDHEVVHRMDREALKLQLTETLRRLTELNHAHEQAREKERDFVPRETHESTVAELRAGIAQAQAFTATALPRETFDTFIREQYRVENGNRDNAIKALQDQMMRRETFDTFLTDQYRPDQESLGKQVKALTDWRNKATGAAVILTLVSGLAGAAIMRALGS